MDGVADQDAGAVGLAAVPGQHRPARGRDVEVVLAEAVGDGHGRAGQAGRDGVAVAAERHQRLAADDPLTVSGRGERRGQRREALGGGELPDGGALAVALADPAVAGAGAERVQRRLGLGDGEVVGHGPPPALRGAVVGLLHGALAVAVPRRAQLDMHAVVLGDRGEGGGDPAGVRARDGGHPVEPPALGQPTEAGRRPRADRRRGARGPRRRRGRRATCPSTAAPRPADARPRRPPVRGRVGQLEPVPLGLLTRRVLDHRVVAALRRARLAVRPDPVGAQAAGERG